MLQSHYPSSGSGVRSYLFDTAPMWGSQLSLAFADKIHGWWLQQPCCGLAASPLRCVCAFLLWASQVPVLFLTSGNCNCHTSPDILYSPSQHMKQVSVKYSKNICVMLENAYFQHVLLLSTLSQRQTLPSHACVLYVSGPSLARWFCFYSCSLWNLLWYKNMEPF